jgi:hypothetical protein
VKAREATEFLAELKTLLGNPVWREGNRPGQFRFVWPIAVNGVGAGPQLEVTHSAHSPHLKLSVMLNIPPVITRVDLDETANHTNRNPRPRDVPKVVEGHNFHRWADNCPPSGVSEVPKILRLCRPLISSLAAYPDVLIWFCGETNIEIDATLIPPLRTMEKLV